MFDFSVCNSDFLCKISFFYTFLLLRLIAEPESLANRGVELPPKRHCPGCVISLITAATLFSMKLKCSIAAFVSRRGVACGVMSNVPTMFNIFTQDGISYKVFRSRFLDFSNCLSVKYCSAEPQCCSDQSSLTDKELLKAFAAL